jgi:hypothetical protein
MAEDHCSLVDVEFVRLQDVGNEFRHCHGGQLPEHRLGDLSGALLRAAEELAQVPHAKSHADGQVLRRIRICDGDDRNTPETRHRGL